MIINQLNLGAYSEITYKDYKGNISKTGSMTITYETGPVGPLVVYNHTEFSYNKDDMVAVISCKSA